jgi:hypothetical protein
MYANRPNGKRPKAVFLKKEEFANCSSFVAWKVGLFKNIFLNFKVSELYTFSCQILLGRTYQKWKIYQYMITKYTK